MSYTIIGTKTKAIKNIEENIHIMVVLSLIEKIICSHMLEFSFNSVFYGQANRHLFL